MKRDIISGRFILLISAAFLVVMGLPIVLASLSGQLDLPVEQSYAFDTQEFTLSPQAGWTIEAALPQGEENPLQPEVRDGGAAVSLAVLPEGEAASLQLTCRPSDRGGAETQVTYQVLRDSAGTVTARVYPENAEPLNLNYVYEFSPDA